MNQVSLKMEVKMNQQCPAPGALCAVLLGLCAAGNASAQNQGGLAATLQFNRVSPHIASGDLSAPAAPGSKADALPDSKPALAITYGLTDRVALEFILLGVPFKHTIVGDGFARGTGKIAEVSALAPSVLLQYRFAGSGAAVQPFLGAGGTYTHYIRETGSGQLTALVDIGGPPTTFKLKNKLAASFQAGVLVNIKPRWFVELSVAKTLLESVTRYSTGQTQQLRFDPVTATMGLGYRF
jgi:outer membrane protein